MDTIGGCLPITALRTLQPMATARMLPSKRWQDRNEPLSIHTTIITLKRINQKVVALVANKIALQMVRSSIRSTTNSHMAFGPHPPQPNAPSPPTPSPLSNRESNWIRGYKRKGPTSPSAIDSAAYSKTRTTKRKNSIVWSNAKCPTCFPRDFPRIPRPSNQRQPSRETRRWIIEDDRGRNPPQASRARSPSISTIMHVSFPKSAPIDSRGTRKECIAFDCFPKRVICC
mmetsp:Transcript_38420/g.80842  ORF Transcript_38420/g.80842 Transcript_38420/m.80842 type:complete len:229 (+) Transcript_38420:574-1260(+)